MIRFFVQGVPKAMSVGKSVRVPMKGRPGSWQQFQTRRNTDWAVMVGELGRAHAPATPMTGAVIFMARFYLPMPASIPQRDRPTAMPVKRPDWDGLVHKLTDFFNGVFWHDDSQIVDVLIRKRYPLDGRTGVEITVAPYTNAHLQAELLQVEVDVEPSRA